ncbi:outer membrane protein [Sulfitobacter delicatus]|jgi:outer membrane immunogenic protein|uniref:Outer membrane protein beta-barrel domain-containing protein n=1 Tax=Sulfitobacter delicatus TaxID=218672 RepID=A0A1G7QHA7_9RHOB|nr:outer membrane beta-barrel protein [Sulfitobacter delicatus]SDF97349.1 Outer membrane protein beta-barrel domain-containing protein [Sulfitobacter delicatus]
MKRTTKIASIALIASGALAGVATAGSLQDTTVEAPVYTPAPTPVATGGDWTGFYGGLQVGQTDIESDSGALDGDDASYGVHAGYDYDFGTFVLGGELDYDKTDIELGGGAANVDSVARAKLKAGYDFGNTLVYATAGAAQADTSVGDESGSFAGLGVTYKVTEQYTVGGEVLQHKFDDVGGTGDDLDATTISLRGSMRF